MPFKEIGKVNFVYCIIQGSALLPILAMLAVQQMSVRTPSVPLRNLAHETACLNRPTYSDTSTARAVTGIVQLVAPLGGPQAAGEGHRLAALLGHSSLRAETHRGDPAGMAGRPPPAAGPPHRGSEGRGAAGRGRVAVLWGAVHLLVPPPGQGATGPHGAAGAQDRISTRQPRVVLDHPAGRDQGSDLLRAYYSGESADGLFAAQPDSHAAQDELLQALDRRLYPEAAAAGEGDLGDGSVSLAELEAAAKSLPRGKAPGLDGIPPSSPVRVLPSILVRAGAGAHRYAPGGLQQRCQSSIAAIAATGPHHSFVQGERSGQGVSGQLQAHHAAEHRLQAGSAGDRQPHRPAAQPGCGRHPDRLPPQALD